MPTNTRRNWRPSQQEWSDTAALAIPSRSKRRREVVVARTGAVTRTTLRRPRLGCRREAAAHAAAWLAPCAQHWQHWTGMHTVFGITWWAPCFCAHEQLVLLPTLPDRAGLMLGRLPMSTRTAWMDARQVAFPSSGCCWL